VLAAVADRDAEPRRAMFSLVAVAVQVAHFLLLHSGLPT
jgi:hypothetical protein